MSVPVGLDRLRDEVKRFGAFAYLLTVSDDGRPHAVAVSAVWSDDDTLTVSAGRTTLANARSRPTVSLLWPPVDEEGYSLIVDGGADVDDATSRVAVRAAKAVLHRARAEGAGSDCVTLLPS